MSNQSLPDGWQISPLSEICSVISGGTPSRDVAEYWQPPEIDWVTPTDITRGESRVLFSAKEKISKKGLSSSSAKLLPVNTVLMTSRATLGEIKVAGVECCTNQRFKSLVAKEGTDPWFLYYQMKRKKPEYEGFGIGSTFLEVNKKDTDRFLVEVAPYHEQQKIAHILTTVDNLIEKTQALIDKYTAVKQGMMHDLFTRGIDLATGELRPSYEQAPELYKETELGWVPREWEVATLAGVSVGGLKNGYFKDPKLLGQGLKLVNVSDLYQDYGVDISIEKVERIAVSPKDYKKYDVCAGDIFFTRSSLVLEGIAKSNIVRDLPEPAVFECHVMRLRPDKNVVDSDFLAMFCEMDWSRRYLMSMAKQVTMTTIAQPDMVGMPVAVPCLEEQKLISEKVIKIIENINSLRGQLEKLNWQKKGLMQDLLTGRVRVGV